MSDDLKERLAACTADVPLYETPSGEWEPDENAIGHLASDALARIEELEREKADRAEQFRAEIQRLKDTIKWLESALDRVIALCRKADATTGMDRPSLFFLIGQIRRHASEATRDSPSVLQ